MQAERRWTLACERPATGLKSGAERGGSPVAADGALEELCGLVASVSVAKSLELSERLETKKSRFVL